MRGIDKETQTAIDGLYNGTLAHSIKKNSKYAMTGALLFGLVGMVVASFTGQSKILFGIGGVALGLTTGYITANKTKN